MSHLLETKDLSLSAVENLLEVFEGEEEQTLKRRLEDDHKEQTHRVHHSNCGRDEISRSQGNRAQGLGCQVDSRIYV